MTVYLHNDPTIIFTTTHLKRLNGAVSKRGRVVVSKIYNFEKEKNPAICRPVSVRVSVANFKSIPDSFVRVIRESSEEDVVVFLLALVVLSFLEGGGRVYSAIYQIRPFP